MKALLLSKLREVVRSSRIFGIYARHATEFSRVFLQNICEIPVIPGVMNDLDDDGSFHTCILHQFQQRLGRCVPIRLLRGGRPRVSRI